MWVGKLVWSSLGQDVIITHTQKQSIVDCQSKGVLMICFDSSNIHWFIQHFSKLLLS